MKSLELVFIIDCSGSMAGLESDTIGGFNAFLEKEKGKESYLTSYLFNHHFKILHDRLDINEVEPLKREDYNPSGTTALLDTIGEAIDHIQMIHRYSKKEDIPEKTLFVIMTDGQENSSKHFSVQAIKEKIETSNFEFIYLGANLDAISTACDYGIRADCASNYSYDETGIKKSYEAIFKAAENLRMGGSVNGWKKEVEKDFKKRGK